MYAAPASGAITWLEALRVLTSPVVIGVAQASPLASATIDVGGHIALSGVLLNHANTAQMGITTKTGSASGDYSTSSGSYADVDTTNLKFVVTIPTGWKLAYNIGGTTDCAASGNPFVALADGGSAIHEQELSLGLSLESFEPFNLSGSIAGDGASHSLTLQFKETGGTVKIRNSTAAQAPRMQFILMPSN
ncbi:MAG TPA: hypothetical protein VKZ50_05015 [bacterium]|nr:hypothetical protein [bacterium]